jgi:hypothetical protein
LRRRANASSAEAGSKAATAIGTLCWPCLRELLSSVKIQIASCALELLAEADKVLQRSTEAVD